MIDGNMEQKNILVSLKISMKYHTTLYCLVSDFTRETYIHSTFKWLLFFMSYNVMSEIKRN